MKGPGSGQPYRKGLGGSVSARVATTYRPPHEQVHPSLEAPPPGHGSRADDRPARRSDLGVPVYIVTIAKPPAEFRRQLEAIADAWLVRELPPRRVVVVLRSAADRPRLAALPGVEAVVVDSLEHPDGSISSR
jgi:hypothetical protein